MIGSKKTKEEPKLSFADRLGKVKSMFVSAYNEAILYQKRCWQTLKRTRRLSKLLRLG